MIKITTDSNFEIEKEIALKLIYCIGDYYRWYTKEEIEKSVNSTNPFSLIENYNFTLVDSTLKEFLEISKEYPNVIIKIEVKYSLSGKSTDYIRYIRNGKSQKCNILKVYESFDPRKFKSYEEEFNHE